MNFGPFIISRKTAISTINSIDSVAAWVKDRPPEDQERIMYGIVRKVYGGKRTIHRNPRTKQEIKAERLESLARVNAVMDTRVEA